MAEGHKPGRPENLIPQAERSPEEARAMGAMGGIKSGEVRREKKLMSQIYAQFLADEHDIEISEGQVEKMSGAALVAFALGKVMEKGGSAAISAAKEIREATEGSFVRVESESIPEITLAPPEAKPEAQS